MLESISKVNGDPNNYSWFNWNDEKDEEILMWEHPSIFPVMGVLVFSVVIILSSFFAAVVTFVGRYALIPVVFVIIASILELVKWKNIHYIITTNRVIKKTGIFRVNPEERDFSDIDGLDPIQGRRGIANAIVERLLKFGDIDINSDNGNIHFENVASYEKYSNELSLKNSENSFREQIQRVIDNDNKNLEVQAEEKTD